MTSVEQVPADDPLRLAAEAFADLGAQLGPAPSRAGFQAIADIAVSRVGSARWASITTKKDDRFVTSASTGEPALRADLIQYEMGTGPCVDAIVDATVYNPEDLKHDQRWPDFGRRVAEEVGMRSMLSYRLAVDGESVIGGLNLYSEQPRAFGSDDVQLGLLIATHAAAVVAMHANRAAMENLQRALDSNRDIGVAIGVLMGAHKVTRAQAFDLLRIASQRSNRKLREIALDVADTGTLDLGH